MPSTTDTTTTRDGIRLLTRHWTADAPRAGVILVHGLGEHSGRYEHVGTQLAAAGLETFSWDLRCFGASTGRRAYVDAWTEFHDDLEDRVAAVRAATAGRPVILYGHSLGGLIALGYAVSERPAPDLLVLSAPGIDDDLAAWKRLAAPALARVVPRLRISNGISPWMLSCDPDRQEAARTDPLNQSSSTTRLGALGFAEQGRVRAAASQLSIRTMVIHGLDDPVVPARATERLALMPEVTRRTYAGLRHELHNEPQGPQVIADVVTWIDAQLAGPSGTASGSPVEAMPAGAAAAGAEVAAGAV